jgi:ABC-type glycerol-3-phosphate transport system substrate-binding protein
VTPSLSRSALLLLLGAAFPAVAPSQAGVALKDRLAFQGAQAATGYGSTRVDPYYGEIEKGYPASLLSADPAAPRPIAVDPPSVLVPDGSLLRLETRRADGGAPTLVWDESLPWIEWAFDLQADDLYEIDLEYYLEPGGSSAAVRSLRVDGAVPWLEAYKLAFPRSWTDAGEPRVNNIGDEVRPRQVEVPAWRTLAFGDSEGMYPAPFRFRLPPGRHTVRLELVEGPMKVGRLFVRPAQPLPAYAEVAPGYARLSWPPATAEVRVQAESAVVEKTDPTLRRESDGDPASEPDSAGYRKLNVMGAWRWRAGGQSITWSFAVPRDGLYKIGLRVGQWWNEGLPSYRRIAVDGRVPFAELAAYKFAWDRTWRVQTLEDADGRPYLFALAAGEHTLTMTVEMGELAELIHSLYDDALLLSHTIRQIVMVTGSDPDPNYEYDLGEQIPGLLDTIRHLRDRMQWKVDVLGRVASGRPAVANNLLTIRSQLDRLLRRPDAIHRRLKDLTDAQTSLGSWFLGIQQAPLVVDYFLVGGPEARWAKGRSTVLQRAIATLRNLAISYVKDYDSVGSVYEARGTETTLLDVWVARGKEWAEVMKEMADESFTPESGIMVNMNVLPPSQLNAGAVNALMLAITSGRAPDVACGVAASSPVEFAIRDAVVDLSRFPDFPEVAGRFLPRIFAPFQYRGGVYGLPETMDFRVLFYRKDILQELGIAVPDDWAEITTRVLPVLYQNGMDFYYSVPTELGAIDHNLAPFVYQHGGDFYSSDGARSALDTPQAYAAFKEYCDLYTGYGLPVVANFYNRMRTGEMPIGVGSYGTYMTLSVAAPELAGRWGIAEFPGHRKPDGTIDRTVGGIAQQADLILAQTEHPAESWQFLKWWSSAPVQERFGKELEALVGSEARWNTANIEAFGRLPWRKEDLEVIVASWKWARDMPVVLGGYFTGRHIVNAWNRVVMAEKSAVVSRSARSSVLLRDSLEQAVKDINRELRMKQEEYGVRESILSERGR